MGDNYGQEGAPTVSRRQQQKARAHKICDANGLQDSPPPGKAFQGKGDVDYAGGDQEQGPLTDVAPPGPAMLAAERDGYTDDQHEKRRDKIREGATVAHTLKLRFATGSGKDGNDIILLEQRFRVTDGNLTKDFGMLIR